MITEGISDEDYADLPGYRSTSLKNILRSPRHYKYALDNPKDSSVFRFGRAFHLLVLQPEESDRIKLIPEVNKRTKAGKEEYAEFVDSLEPGEIPLAAADYHSIYQMLDSVTAAFGDVFASGKGELTGQFYSDEYGFCKVRLDWVEYHSDKTCTIWDLKSCQDASLKPFKRDAWRYMYHLSAAYYFDIAAKLDMAPRAFNWIPVEKTPPYACAAYECSEVSLSVGREMYEKALVRINQCELADEWPGYDTDVIPLDIT